MTSATVVRSDDAEFTPGLVLKGNSRTVTDAEIAFLPALMGAINPLFHDDVQAKAGPMGSRILYGPALLGIAVALTEHLLRHRVIGLVELTSVRFLRPVRVGDTVSATLTVRSCAKREGKPGLMLSVDDQIHNQEAELVLSFQRAILITG